MRERGNGWRASENSRRFASGDGSSGSDGKGYRSRMLRGDRRSAHGRRLTPNGVSRSWWTIFVHDEHGRMEKESRAVVDGTFLGPDAIAELVAMHLHRLGAAEAASVTFGSDGAPMDLGPNPDDRAAGQIGRGADPRSPGLLPCRSPHFPGFGGAGVERSGTDAVVP